MRSVPWTSIPSVWCVLKIDYYAQGSDVRLSHLFAPPRYYNWFFFLNIGSKLCSIVVFFSIFRKRRSRYLQHLHRTQILCSTTTTNAFSMFFGNPLVQKNRRVCPFLCKIEKHRREVWILWGDIGVSWLFPVEATRASSRSWSDCHLLDYYSWLRQLACPSLAWRSRSPRSEFCITSKLTALTTTAAKRFNYPHTRGVSHEHLCLLNSTNLLVAHDLVHPSVVNWWKCVT